MTTFHIVGVDDFSSGILKFNDVNVDIADDITFSLQIRDDWEVEKSRTELATPFPSIYTEEIKSNFEHNF
jgi:hypothetical protein